MIRPHDAGRRDGDGITGCTVDLASLDHVIFPKISFRHRNFFLPRIAP
jgi:hypothetical protein